MDCVAPSLHTHQLASYCCGGHKWLSYTHCLDKKSDNPFDFEEQLGISDLDKCVGDQGDRCSAHRVPKPIDLGSPSAVFEGLTWCTDKPQPANVNLELF